MMTKKPYTPPQIFRVELNQQQAILAACSTTQNSVSVRGVSACSTASRCKRWSSTGTSAAPAS